MLISLDVLRGYRVVAARNADLGPMDEIYFDDQEWKVRFFIVRTSRFLGRDGLIAPAAVGRANPPEERLELALTRKQVEDSPPLDFAKPVAQQEAQRYFAHYGWPYTWAGGAGMWGIGMARARGYSLPPPTPEAASETVDPHLRSLREVTGYRIQGTDDDIGHLEDVIVDDEDWTIRYLVVDTRNWWPGKRVLLPPASVESSIGICGKCG